MLAMWLHRTKEHVRGVQGATDRRLFIGRGANVRLGLSVGNEISSVIPPSSLQVTSEGVATTLRRLGASGGGS